MIKGSIFPFFSQENPIPTHLERPGFFERLALEEEAVSCQRVKVGGGEDRSEVNHLSHPLHRLLHLREGGREGGGEDRSEVNHLSHPLHYLLHLREGGREGGGGGHTSTYVEPVGRDGEREGGREERKWRKKEGREGWIM